MSTFNHGGPAFPCDRIHDKDDRLVSHVGMTMRDYFAAAWLQGAAADPTTREWRHFADHRARTAYVVADAMLRARSQP